MSTLVSQWQLQLTPRPRPARVADPRCRCGQPGVISLRQTKPRGAHHHATRRMRQAPGPGGRAGATSRGGQVWRLAAAARERPSLRCVHHGAWVWMSAGGACGTERVATRAPCQRGDTRGQPGRGLEIGSIPCGLACIEGCRATGKRVQSSVIIAVALKDTLSLPAPLAFLENVGTLCPAATAATTSTCSIIRHAGRARRLAAPSPTLAHGRRCRTITTHACAGRMGRSCGGSFPRPSLGVGSFVSCLSAVRPKRHVESCLMNTTTPANASTRRLGKKGADRRLRAVTPSPRDCARLLPPETCQALPVQAIPNHVELLFDTGPDHVVDSVLGEQEMYVD